MKKRITFLAAFAAVTLAVSGLVLAHGGGGMGSGGAMMGGSGMMVVADDASLLVTNMDMSGMVHGGGASNEVSRDLINLSADGTERWRVSFTEGWPMIPATDGDLVVVVLVDDWFMGSGGMGDGGFGGGMGGGMMGITTMDAGHGGNGSDEVIVVGLDLATGAERWRTTLEGDMGSMVQFSPDGMRLYISLMDMGTGSGAGTGPMSQGDAAGSGVLTSNTIVALDRSGNQLWSYETGNTGGMGSGMGGMAVGRR